MSVDMVTAEHQAPAGLGDDPGFEDAAERDVSMVAHEGLNDITFDADDSYLGYSTSDQAANAHPIPVEDELDYNPNYESSGPVDARLDHQDTAGADRIPLEDEVGEDNNTAVGSAIPHGVLSEIDAHQIPDDHEAPSDLQIPRSPAATQLSAPGDDDLVGEIDYEDNGESGETFVEVAQQSGAIHEPDEVDNEGAYLDDHKQSPEESADLGYAVLNSEPGNDHTHTTPPNEEPDSPASRHGDGDEFDLDAKGHDDHTGLDGVGLDSDAEDALPPAQADLSAHDHHQEPSVSEEERDDNYGGEDDPEYMDVAEIDDQALDEFSTRPQVRIRYRDTTYSLFSTSKSDDPYSFFFSDIEALEHPLSQFLAGLREVLSDEITPDEDVLIRIDGLGLEFADTMDKSSLDRVTFGAIVDLHDRLVKADDPDTRDAVLLVYLVTRPNAMRRLDSLLDAASIGEGLSAYHVSYPDYLLIDFPAREDSAETTSESTPHTSNGGGNADLESDQDPDEDAQHGELQGADRESPPHTNATSDWHESGDVADQDENLLGDSYDQVIDDVHERTSVYSNHSASHKSSPTGPWDHETDDEAIGEQHPEALAYERAESDVEDTRSDQGSGTSDAYLNPVAALDEADEEAEPTYETEERQVGPDDQELDEIDDLITEELETSDKGQVEGKVEGNAAGPSYTADDDHDLGTWEDGEHDAGVAAGEGIPASPLRNTEPCEPPEAEAEARDVDNAQEAVVGEDQPFEMLRRQSAADTANAAASLENSSASATLDGEEIDLEEVLATADPTDGDQLNDDFENSHEEPPEADEIDWEDNENDGAVADGITTPSSNTGKRAREVDDVEAPGDRHDVKRHRT